VTPLSELGDAADAIGYLFGFWLFVLSPSYRERRWNAFVGAGWLRRLGYGLHATVATACGLGGAALLIWLVAM
jgi:hypothetical protein